MVDTEIEPRFEEARALIPELVLKMPMTSKVRKAIEMQGDSKNMVMECNEQPSVLNRNVFILLFHCGKIYLPLNLPFEPFLRV